MDIKVLVENLHEQYKKEAPETNKCSCKLNLTYDKNSERCKECYAAGKVLDDLFKIAVKTGNNQLALFLAFAAHSPKIKEEEEDEDNK